MNRITIHLTGILMLLSIGIPCAQTLPFHLPEGAGSFRLGIVNGTESRWLDECRVKQHQQNFTITDDLWKGGEVRLTVLPLSDTQGFIVEASGKGLPDSLQLCWAFGACDETIQAPPADNVIDPAACADNVFSIEGNAFLVYYGKVMALRTVIGIAPLSSVIRLSDAHRQTTPLQLWESGKKTDSPVISSCCPWDTDEKLYFCFYHQNERADYNYYLLPDLFQKEAK